VFFWQALAAGTKPSFLRSTAPSCPNLLPPRRPCKPAHEREQALMEQLIMSDNPADRRSFLILLILSGLVFLYLLLRNTGLYVNVIPDEYIYSRFARLLPASKADIPNYLYYMLFGLTNHCGEGFLECARIINSLLFVAASPFVYFIAVKVTTKPMATIVSIAAIIGPINYYTAFFMPESFYFFWFWLLIWYLLKLDVKEDISRWAIAGALYALLALIKPPAVFFLPAIVAYIFFVTCKQRLWRRGFVISLIFVASAVLVKFGLSYLFAGQSGMTVFGSFYGTFASSKLVEFDRYLPPLMASMKSLWGHLLILSMIYGVPLTVALSVGFWQSRRGAAFDEFGKICVFSLLVIINLVVVTAVYTVTQGGPGLVVLQLHMRYYDFALPLFYIVSAGALGNDAVVVNRKVRAVFAGIVGSLVLYALYTNMIPYQSGNLDSPEYSGLYANKVFFDLVGVLSILAIVYWVATIRSGAQLYLYGVLPVVFLVSGFYTSSLQRERLVPNVYDRAGIFMKHYLEDGDASKILIVGSDPYGLHHVLFILDRAEAAADQSLDLISEGSSYDISKLPAGKEWVLIIGDHSLQGAPSFQIPLNGFTLARR
jgi:phosphoglycerol transferase